MNKIIKTKEPIKKTVYNYEKKDFPALSLEQIKSLKKIKLVYGDITTIACDAVVNSANNTLLGGGGVDGAIHAAAGPKLRQECAKLGGCETGEAKITKAYKLPCKYVIHTVGPIYSRDQRETQSEELRNCYYNSLKLAQENNIKTINSPAATKTNPIGKLSNRFPMKKASAKVAYNNTKAIKRTIMTAMATADKRTVNFSAVSK